MQTKIDLIKYLIHDIEKEKQLFSEYKSEIERAKKEATKAEKSNGNYWYYIRWNEPLPSKQKIKDDLKLIRRLCLEIAGDLYNL